MGQVKPGRAVKNNPLILKPPGEETRPGELKYGGPGPKGRRGGYAQMTVVGAVTVRDSAIELGSNPGHADQRNGGGDDIELHIAQPREVLQTGITQKVNRHQCNNYLVHAHIRLSVTTCCFDGYSVNRQ